MNGKLRYLFIAIGVVVVGFILWYFKSIVAYILISGVLSLIGRPLVNFLEKLHIYRFKIPHALSALVTLLLMWIFIIVFFRIFIPLIANQATEISSIDVNSLMLKFQEPIDRIVGLFEKFNGGEISEKSIEQYISEKLMSLLNVSILSGFFSSIASILGNIFIAAFSISFMTFFFLKDKGLFYQGIFLFVPDKYLKNVEHVLQSIKKLLTRYFIGIIVQITCIITLVSIGLTLVGLDFSDALVTGLLVGIFNVIPYIGPIIGASLGLIMGLATHLELPFYTDLLPLLGWMLLVFIIVQVIDNIVFQPVIYSSSVNAHPLEIFIILLMAGSLFGITGMILAIPTYTIIRVFLKEFFNNFKLVKKLTEKI
ncbi:MAG: AI-2E family transporter [Bacteroidales bacterium]